MGFNFGAFAAGALEGAGEIMEKQHKETKDTINKQMEFAYAQGLPFHRARKERLRKMTGLASDLQSLNLTPAQVNSVMGKSDAYATEFLKSSLAELGRNPNFDVSSQITDIGTSGPWRPIKMGTVDPASLVQPAIPQRSSVFGAITGTNGGTSDGSSRLRDRAQASYEATTGVSYDDVSAASQGNYTYADASDAVITLKDSSSFLQQSSNEMSVETQRMNLNFAKNTQAGKLEEFYVRLKASKTAGEAAEMQAEIDKIMQPALIAAADFAVEAGTPVELLKDNIVRWNRNALLGRFGSNPQEGLHIATVSLYNELKSDNPNAENVALLKETIELQNISIGSIKSENESDLSFGHFNIAYNSMLVKHLNKAFPDPKNRNFTIGNDGTPIWDMTGTVGSAVEQRARESANYDFLKMARQVVRNTGDSSKHLVGFAASLGIEKSKLELPLFPSKQSKIKADTNYLIMDKANSIFYERTGQEYFNALEEKAASEAQEQEGNLTAERAATISSSSPFTTTSMSSEDLDTMAGDYAELAKGRTTPSVVRDPDDFTDEYRLHENEQDYYRRMAASNLRSVPLSQQEQLADMYRKLRYENDAMTDKEFREGLDLLRAHGTTFSQLKFAETNIKALQSS